MAKLTGAQIAQEGPAGWAYLLGSLHTRLHTGTFAAGLALVDAIGAAAEEMDHHPDLDLRYTHVDVRLSSHDAGGVTERDLRLARAVTTLAADAGVRLDPASVSVLELGLDTPARDTVRPFWAAVLAVPADDRGELQDPAGALPGVWFQPSGDEEPRQRWHFDVWVEPAQVQPRIDAALAAGGRLVRADGAPRFWVLADPEGNHVCLCTWQERD
ncbi:4a-hydroxytetrahydrobiopterin dehydratase [Nonomuraea sp. NPDC003560]|uniref:4a-hydroxytetrahydrobiopterin dehydratase n=1 Tax=Nonomuraea sp. NPDC003560 TaxID=3364341 RepID=UPI00367B06FC